MSLVEFLRARIAEEQAAARLCEQHLPGEWESIDRGYIAYVTAGPPIFRRVMEVTQEHLPAEWLGEVTDHIATWSPERVLADCAVRLAIIETVDPWTCKPDPAPGAPGCHFDTVLGHLARPYVHHRDFDPEWLL